MSEDFTMARGAETEIELDAEMRSLLVLHESALETMSGRGGGEDWDAPLDLRVARPRATDLRAVWKATNQEVPAQLAGAVGATRPVLITHTITPFAIDGRAPVQVWGLGYELVARDIDADSVGVAPSSEVYKVADIGQTVSLGIDMAGKFAVAEGLPDGHVAVRATTNQRFQFRVAMTITLRKVVGAPVGIGGAQWKMYRQDEPLDEAHTLLQVVLVPEAITEMRCTLKTWAKQAGWLGTNLGAKFWPYADQDFAVKLA